MRKARTIKLSKPKRGGRRNLLRSLFFAGASLLPGVGMAAPKPALPHVAAALRGAKHTLKIVAFGSSSTKGFGASSEAAAYPARLQDVLSQRFSGAYRIEVSNRGVGGEDIDDMMKRIADVIAERPDLVIWQIGSNDPIRGVPLERFDAEARAGIAALRAAGIDVMLMEPQWCPTLDRIAGSDAFMQDVRKIGDELGLPVIRRTELMHRWVAQKRITPEKLLSSDGLHMTDASYAMLAEDVAETILTTVEQGAPAVAQATDTALR